MRLFPYDAYKSLTRVFTPDQPLVALDVGGNAGQTASRIISLFNSATVYSFEPSPFIYPKLQEVAARLPGVRPQPVAVGDVAGTLEFNVTGEDWCSSILPPSELGKRFYGSWVEVTKKINVPVVRLDDWAEANNITRVDLLKTDTQGYDLHVLRGAERLLRSGIKAINCEFQFAEEYQGCSTFTQIDAYLHGLGFRMYQLHEVYAKGNEEQTACGDGLWLRSDVLEALRARKDLPDLSPAGRMSRALRENAVPPDARIALYGAGHHTRQLLPALGSSAATIRAVIDDDRTLHGSQVEGKPIIPLEQVASAGIDTVVLSSDSFEPVLWRACSALRGRGIRVIPLYGRYDG